MRRRWWILTAVILSAALSGQAAYAATGFTTRVSPATQTNATEPSVAVDRSDGTIYVAWQASGTHVARSDDGGRSFVQTPINDFFGRDIGDVAMRVGGPTACMVPAPNCVPGTHRVYVATIAARHGRSITSPRSIHLSSTGHGLPCRQARSRQVRIAFISSTTTSRRARSMSMCRPTGEPRLSGPSTCSRKTGRPKPSRSVTPCRAGSRLTGRPAMSMWSGSRLTPLPTARRVATSRRSRISTRCGSRMPRHRGFSGTPTSSSMGRPTRIPTKSLPLWPSTTRGRPVWREPSIRYSPTTSSVLSTSTSGSRTRAIRESTGHPRSLSTVAGGPTISRGSRPGLAGGSTLSTCTLRTWHHPTPSCRPGPRSLPRPRMEPTRSRSSR